MSTAVLLLHGYLTGPDDWDSVIPELKEMYDEVNVFRNPGHARGDEREKLDYSKFTHDATYAYLIAELDYLFAKHTEVDIIGFSMGGAMAVWAAANYPVRKISIIAPAFRFPRLGIFFKHFVYRAKMNKLKKMRISPRHAASFEAEINRYDEDHRLAVKLLFSRFFPHITPHTVRTLYLNTKKGQKAIKKVKCPVQVLWGHYDEFISERTIRIFVKRLASDDITVVTYGNVNHTMMLSVTGGAIVRDVLAFLRGKKVEEIKPENAAEDRHVTHIFAENDNGEKIKRVKSFKTGTQVIEGRVELVEETTNSVAPH